MDIYTYIFILKLLECRGFQWQQFTNPFNFFPLNNYNSYKPAEEPVEITTKATANPFNFYPFANNFPFVNYNNYNAIVEDVQEPTEEVHEPVEGVQEPAETGTSGSVGGFISGTSCSLSCVNGVCQNICKVCYFNKVLRGFP